MLAYSVNNFGLLRPVPFFDDRFCLLAGKTRKIFTLSIGHCFIVSIGKVVKFIGLPLGSVVGSTFDFAVVDFTFFPVGGTFSFGLFLSCRKIVNENHIKTTEIC